MAINRLVLAFIADFSGGGQTGRMALVNGQQSYDVVFPEAFAAAPTGFFAGVLMVSSSGEAFYAQADLSTLTATGVTVWLNAPPTAASVGSYLTWIAIP